MRAARRSPLAGTGRLLWDTFVGSPQPMWVHDEGGTVVDANQAAATLTGRPPADLRGTPLADHVVDPPTGGAAGRPGLLRRGDGTTVPAELSVQRVVHHGRAAWLTTARVLGGGGDGQVDGHVHPLELEGALRRAIRGGELVVHFQPELDLRSGGVVGVEALVRWRRPDGALAPPAMFLPAAEASGQIIALGEAVLEDACRAAARWHRPGVTGPTVWVNLSARQLADPSLVTTVAGAVGRWLPEPAALGLEITETAIVPDDPRIERLMFQLTELGVRVAIDDFGTGYASLAYLWRFPADVVKLDRAFVRRLGDDRNATVIVAGTLQLARSLGRTTVAEGIETTQQLVRLRRFGCDVGQGYLLGMPGPAEGIPGLL